MIDRKSLRAAVFILATLAIAAPVAAINVVIDYTYDTNNFFGAGNPSGATAGAQAKVALEAAASFFTNVLNDTFSSIQTPPQFNSSTFNGQVTWQWSMNFTNPATGNPMVVTNPTVAANQYIVYAGARNIGGTTAGIGGPGGFNWSSNPTGGFTQPELNQINNITAQFKNAVEERGEPINEFASWGGAITFDRDGSTNWFYNHTVQPSGSVVDFYSVALHELGHAVGFGSSSEFQALVESSPSFSFKGANAKALNGGVNVPLNGNAHWANGTQSFIYGTGTLQEAAMDPDIFNGTRKRFTELDVAALRDIGWETIALPNSGDYNGNGVVDAADYVLWRNTLGTGVSNGTGADGSGNGSIGNEDYTFWRNRFGNVAASGTGTSLDGGIVGVPEPVGLSLVVIAGASVLCARRKRCG